MNARVAVLLFALTSFTVAASLSAQDNAPITFHVSSPLLGEKGLSRVLTAAAEGNTDETAVDVERALAGSRWLKPVSSDPEALIHIDRRSRTETRTEDKDGAVTVNHVYRIQAMVDAGGSRHPITVDSFYSDKPGAYRDDSMKFREMARDVASRAAWVIASQLDILRPNRAQNGFAFQAKYRFGVKGDGLEVTAVVPGGPAEQAGLRVKDRIRSIDGEKGTDQMRELMQSSWIEGAGRRYRIEYERDKQRQTAELALAPGAFTAAGAPAPGAPRAQAPTRSAGGGTRSTSTSARTAAAPAAGSSSTAAGNVELKVGMAEADLIRVMGAPQKKVSFGPKSVWTYEGFTLTLVGGKVTDIK